MFGNEQQVATFDTPFEMLPERTAEDLQAKHSLSVFPAGLFDREPGPELAAYMSVIDPTELSGHDQVRVLQAHQKLASHFAAKVYEDIGALTDVMVDFDGDAETGMEATALELRAALRLTRRMAGIEIEFADNLKHRLPAVGVALGSGMIDPRRARVLVNGTLHLSETQARKVVEKVMDRAGELTTGELAARVRKLCLAIEPEEAKQRYETAIEQRRLAQEATLEGTANITLFDVSPDRAAQAFSRINKIAKTLHVSGETRTMDQLRADIALDLLTGTHRSKTSGTVNIHVDLDTLAQLNQQPGDLAGYGPVVADIARQVTEQQQSSEWRFRVNDPDTGLPVHTGTTRRRPNAEQKRHVELRDLTCVFPGCRMPATDCDIDHVETWVETGRTTTKYLAPGCRHDHVGRHKYGWTYRPLPGGDYIWTSRLGHTYTTSGRPPPTEV
jgi:Domain of unknown function (DUF222)